MDDLGETDVPGLAAWGASAGVGSAGAAVSTSHFSQVYLQAGHSNECFFNTRIFLVGPHSGSQHLSQGMRIFGTQIVLHSTLKQVRFSFTSSAFS
jgi:hypothetical protein